jgi:hypothetical protein
MTLSRCGGGNNTWFVGDASDISGSRIFGAGMLGAKVYIRYANNQVRQFIVMSDEKLAEILVLTTTTGCSLT